MSRREKNAAPFQRHALFAFVIAEFALRVRNAAASTLSIGCRAGPLSSLVNVVCSFPLFAHTLCSLGYMSVSYRWLAVSRSISIKERSLPQDYRAPDSSQSALSLKMSTLSGPCTQMGHNGDIINVRRYNKGRRTHTLSSRAPSAVPVLKPTARLRLLPSPENTASITSRQP